jgi:hypothetical protein
MKKVELIENSEGGLNFKCDDTVIETTNYIDSWSFWDKLEEAANKAKFRLQRGKPEKHFNFDLASMMTTPAQRRQGLIAHINKQYSGIDGEKLCNIVDAEVEKIKLSGPEEAMNEHPNPFMKMKPDSDLFKAIIASVINEYQKTQ